MRPLVVGVLDNVRSLHNVGAIFRTADGVGVSTLYLCGITPAPVDALGRPRGALAKVSLGAEKSVAWKKVSSTARLLTQLKKEGFFIVALEQARGARSYDALKIKKYAKVALVVGREVEGISPAILKKADAVIEIPMRGAKESLNVSVAFGIAVYELMRR